MNIKRQTVWSMMPLLVISVVNIVSVPLFYRYLGAEMYALWFYVLTFTGAFGFMPYRSIQFRHETHNQEVYQEAPVVNYPAENVPETRVSEFKYLTGQQHPRPAS